MVGWFVCWPSSPLHGSSFLRFFGSLLWRVRAVSRKPEVADRVELEQASSVAAPKHARLSRRSIMLPEVKSERENERVKSEEEEVRSLDALSAPDTPLEQASYVSILAATLSPASGSRFGQQLRGKRRPRTRCNNRRPLTSH